ncbi:hypothetical protein [Streptomyces luteireticuli]|uniref:Uncharacterized protein n=1 Tax=Streptomyces luteireticuli TaxID=173858 RepID=A0ABN0YWG2_9ACTN
MTALPRTAPALQAATVKGADAHRTRALEHLHGTLGWDGRRHAAVERAVLDVLARRGGATAAELAAETADLREQIVDSPGKS